MKLTMTSAEKLETTGKRYSQFDDEPRGCAVRRHELWQRILFIEKI